MTKEERLKAAAIMFENEFDGYLDDRDSTIAMTKDRFIECVGKLIAGAEAEAESKWVSTKDRLPDHSEEFNCVQKLDEGMPVSTCMDFEFVSKKWYYPGSTIEAKGITHWQTIPQPPLNQQ